MLYNVLLCQALPPEEEKELKETLQDIIGHGKKVKLEQKVQFVAHESLVLYLYFSCLTVEASSVSTLTLLLCARQIDPSILGGLVVEFSQKVFDMSIRTRAREMERFLRDPINIGNL